MNNPVADFGGRSSYAAVLMVRDAETGMLRPPEYDADKGGLVLSASLGSASSFRKMVLPSYTGNASKFLRVNAGETDVEWATVTLTPGGSDKQLQYNDGGTAFGGAAGLEWTKTGGNLSLSPAGTLGITPTGVLTVNPTAASTINNCSIGATTAKTGRFTTVESTQAAGTPPFTVASNTLVTNLNADLLDGNEASAFAAAVHTHSYVSSVSGTSPIASSGGLTPAISLAVSAADKYLYSTALNTWTEGSITTAGRAILDDAAASNQCTTLGLGTGDSPTFAGLTIANNGIYINSGFPQGINAYYDLDDDLGSLSLNYKGYQNGTTRYRVLNIYDGKTNLIAAFTRNSITFNQPLTITSYELTVNGNCTLNDWFDQSVKAAATPSFNGIKFPAIQSPSADANTLDDYEEGTWGVDITNDGSSSTWTTKNGKYTKIGRMVYCTFLCDFGNSGTAGSKLILGGLPFAHGGDNNIPALVALAANGLAAGCYTCRLLNGATSFDIVDSAGATQTAQLTFCSGIIIYHV